MRKYNVLKVDSLQDCFLVIANTCENPINDLLCDGDVSFIENGNVIFDLAVMITVLGGYNLLLQFFNPPSVIFI